MYIHFNDIHHFVFVMVTKEIPLQLLTIPGLGSLQSTMALVPTFDALANAPLAQCISYCHLPGIAHHLLHGLPLGAPDPLKKRRFDQEVKLVDMSPPCDLFVSQQNGGFSIHESELNQEHSQVKSGYGSKLGTNIPPFQARHPVSKHAQKYILKIGSKPGN